MGTNQNIAHNILYNTNQIRVNNYLRSNHSKFAILVLLYHKIIINTSIIATIYKLLCPHQLQYHEPIKTTGHPVSSFLPLSLRSKDSMYCLCLMITKAIISNKYFLSNNLFSILHFFSKKFKFTVETILEFLRVQVLSEGFLQAGLYY